jgi:hypothetical protein
VFGAELFDAAAAASALPFGAVSLAPFNPIKTTAMIACQSFVPKFCVKSVAVAVAHIK